MLRLCLLLAGISAGLFSGSVSEAKTFTNAYISFNMPDTWNCVLEQTEWVCRSIKADEAKEAIIILTAKEVGPTDTYENYRNHLNNPIQAASRNTISQITYKSKENRINNQEWLDGLHLGSEVPSYYTRYLATIKDGKIAILVTFSAHKNLYPKYSQLFFEAISSLRVNATTDLLNKLSTGPIGDSHGDLFDKPSGGIPIGDDPVPVRQTGKSNLFIALGLILGALGIYFILKARQKKK